MSTPLQQWLEEQGAELTVTGADAAILGVGTRCGQPPLVVYDREKLVQHFVSTGMTPEEAEEWVSYNVDGSWVGDLTPIVLLRPEPEVCAWTPDSSREDDIWSSGCGEEWVFNDGGPAENGCRFCHHCGKPVALVPRAEDPDDET